MEMVASKQYGVLEKSGEWYRLTLHEKSGSCFMETKYLKKEQIVDSIKLIKKNYTFSHQIRRDLNKFLKELK